MGVCDFHVKEVALGEVSWLSDLGLPVTQMSFFVSGTKRYVLRSARITNHQKSIMTLAILTCSEPSD